MTWRGRLGSSASAIETPGARKLTLSACRFGLDSANGVSRDQATASENKRNNTDASVEQGENGSLSRFGRAVTPFQNSRPLQIEPSYVMSEYEPEMKFGRSQNRS